MRLESPVKRFPGYVILPDFLTVPQVQAITAALPKPDAVGEVVWQADADIKNLPILLVTVKEWRLSGIPESPTLDTFPMSPRRSVHALIEWLTSEIIKLWDAEEEVPNG